MKRKIFITLLTILSLGLMLALAHGLVIIPQTNLYFVPPHGQFNILHLQYNSFIVWDFKSIFLDVLELIGHFDRAALFNSYAWLILFFGINLLLYWLLRERSVAQPIIASTVLLFSLATFFGNDPLVLNTICWVPWLILLLLCMESKTKIDWPCIICALVLGFEVVRCANQFSVATFAIAIISYRRLSEKRGQTNWTEATLYAIFFLFVCLAWYQLQIADLPAYPVNAHLVQDDGLPGVIRPWLGPDYAISVQDRGAIKLYMCLFLFCFGIVLLPSIMFCLHRGKRGALAECCVLFLLIFLDSVPSEQINQISPLAVMARILPGINFYPLAAICAAWANVSFSIETTRQFRNVWFCLLLCLLPFMPIGINGTFWTSSGPKDFRHPHNALHDYKMLSGEVEQLPSDKRYKALYSPSYHLVNSLGLWVLERKHEFLSSSKRALKDLALLEVHASHNDIPSRIGRMIDGKYSTRWSAKSGRQNGDEWIWLGLNQEQTLLGIELATGDFRTDFPRGIRVVKPDNCKWGEPGSAAGHTVLQVEDWQGEVKYAESIYPYFSGQDSVLIYFSEPVRTSCLKIEQISKTDNFDWSVAEINLIVPN